MVAGRPGASRGRDDRIESAAVTSENGQAEKSLSDVLGDARRNASVLARLDREMETERGRRVELVRSLVNAGMNFATIGEIYGLSKQRVSSVLHPARKQT